MSAFNWFDILVVGLLIVGVFHGRKRGMSLELLPLFELLVIIVVGSKIYGPLGQKLAEWTNGTLSAVLSFVCAYILFGLIVHMVITRIKTAVGEKLVGSDIFGSMEYYFGMLAGSLRYACMVLIALALLNAKPIDHEKERAYRKAEKDNMGNISFPTYTSIQIAVFEQSSVGKLSRKYVSHLLISPSGVENKAKRETVAKRRERAVEEVMFGTSAQKTAPASASEEPQAQ
ncbi:MAG: CvpA family protein [Limisphaerales bacterium]